MKKKAIIIGAGPAGLTAAYELLKRTDIIPIILEKSGDIGGISKTINYKGNRMDMGPHRFFSKSDRVMEWWLNIMPLEHTNGNPVNISYQNKSRDITPETNPKEEASDPNKKMLVIQRLTRIYFLRHFFAYPIQLSVATLCTLGFVRTIKILFSFLYVQLFPRRPEESLEDFIINKFGKQLYLLFFKDYTEKVWGVPCHQISADWGAQRIKGVSLSKAILQAVKAIGKKNKGQSDIHQKEIETSLIEQFLYPRKGPGALWEEVARQVEEMGGKIFLKQEVQKIYQSEQTITAVITINSLTGQISEWEGDYFFSTMPVKELIAGMGSEVPEHVQRVAAGLQYRDFINVGILLKQLSAPVKGIEQYKKLELKDNWIYIQERDVKVGRLMIYNNWGDSMIKDPNTTWIGMEYFCNTTDDLWGKDDETIQGLAIMELEKMGLARVEDVLDATVRRMEKTYPAYFGTYCEFDKIREYSDQFTNLFLVGRNGMHKYNNADHSMLTAMVSVDNIVEGIASKENIWSINTEMEYHEEKQVPSATQEDRHKESSAKGSAKADPYGLLPSFPDFIWRNKGNRAYLLLALGVFLLQLIFFKARYPFANYMPDSYSYLEAAYTNADVNMWPVAYSKFLRQISVFTHSDKIVVAIQFFFFQVSALVFLMTILRVIRFRRATRMFLYAFFMVNPVPIYVSNYISADALFIGLSLLWMSSLVWILTKPKPIFIVVQAFLLLACFTVRYNAIIYPIFSAIALLGSSLRWKWKLSGLALGSFLVLVSYLVTSSKMQELTGKRQFSGFGGWQLANNALYMYQEIPATRRHAVPRQYAKLETMVRQHLDTLRKVKLTAADTANGYFYLWSHRGPLYQYMFSDYKKDSTTPFFKRWASESPLYLNYAKFLIAQYPLEYARDFVLPNLVKFAIPPAEFLSVYNMGSDSVGVMAKTWFNYPSLKVTPGKPKEKGKDKLPLPTTLMDRFSTFAGIVNIFLLCCLIGAALLTGFKQKDPRLTGILVLLIGFWLINMAFSLVASPIVMRYQVFPLLVGLILALFLAENIYQYAVQKDEVDACGVP